MEKFNESESQILEVIKQVSQIVSKMAGIQLGEKQYPMVKSRLSGRMLRLKIRSFSEYLDYVNENEQSETQILLSLLTTHHTFFFREFAHFEFLLNQALNPLIQRARQRGDRKIRIWSAASSRGQEAYSLAMFFNFHLPALAPDVDFEIWGTDIDHESVGFAQNGVYKHEELKQAPAMYVNQCWSRGTGAIQEFSRVKPVIKNKCRFQKANLLDSDPFLKDKTFDLIFCRNVYIYFDPNQIKHSTQKMMQHMDPQGYLVLGVSESLNGLGLNMQSVGPSIYQHTAALKKAPAPTPSAAKSTGKVATIPPLVAAKPATPKIYRVLCVDDSPTILNILKKILDEKSGFKVVATVENGQKAIDYLKKNEVDIITLDLHMPELDGLGFLSQYKERKAPVVIVSSVNRDDLSIAQKALSLGASDYIEKPSLENISQASNELRAKLKTVLSLTSSSPASKKAA